MLDSKQFNTSGKGWQQEMRNFRKASLPTWIWTIRWTENLLFFLGNALLNVGYQNKTPVKKVQQHFDHKRLAFNAINTSQSNMLTYARST